MTVSVLCVSLPLLRTRIVPWLRKGSVGLFSMEGYRLTFSCPYVTAAIFRFVKTRESCPLS
jgi:hypothetical protein